MTRGDFFSFSKEIVEGFLQTAIIVDDGADFNAEIESKPHSGLTPASESPLKQAKKAKDDKSKSVKPSEHNPEEKTTHRLDAKKVIDSFARKGIVCSVICFEEEDREKLTDTLHNLAKCADILVLDWSLQKDNGQKALEIIKKLASESIEKPVELRLIAIYTGTPNINEISQQVRQILKELNETDFKETDDGFTLMIDYTRIVIIAKEGTMIPKEYKSRLVSFSGLPERLTTEFSEMTSGLISNVVLNSLAKIRQNTHKILTNFSSGLDAPYLTHRLLLTNPDDAKEQLILLIAGEILAILEEAQTGEKIDIDAIKAWIKEKNVTEFILDGNTQFTHNQLVDLLKNGIEKFDGISHSIKRNAHQKPFTSMLSGQPNNAQFLDNKFSCFTTMRSFYKLHNPKLTLGTIIKSDSKKPEYWLCIQPRCDCVRIESSRSFIFLPLQMPDGNNSKFDTIIHDNDEYVRLRTVNKSFEIKLITFRPSQDGKQVITAEEHNDSFCFSDIANKKYKWIGELRFEQAQRISNDFAANVARVGLDESEWLRRWKERG